MEIERIRNFSIVAHIDHGKSTLADRLLEATGSIPPRMMRDQVLDSMDLERERGITIKSHAARMEYKARDGKTYSLNLIDTPGHVDFTYEVSRALAACEGVFLLVDASQGIEAQTISNLYLALDNNLTIIPVVNKIDLSSARPKETAEELSRLLGVPEEEVIYTSGKEGIGVLDILEAAVQRIPSPRGKRENPLTALVFDAYYDNYRGVVVYVRVFDGYVKRGMRIRFFATGAENIVEEVGFIRLGLHPTDELSAGEVGYIIAGIKSVREARVGDTITSAESPAEKPIPGYREAKPMVFSGFYPTSGEGFEELKEALEKLQLNDAAIKFEPENSLALGLGFRCGFLGLLHLEIVQERLSREYNLDLIATIPNVEYQVLTKKGEIILVDNPAKLPDPAEIETIEEPFVKAEIITPPKYIGNLLRLIVERRGEVGTTEYIDPSRAVIHFTIPLAEIIFDFYDKLKSMSQGYASLDYEFAGFKPSDLVKLDILVNGEPVDALSVVVHRSNAYRIGSELCRKLKELIPRQLYEVIIQAAIGSRIIARTRIPPIRKNVTAKCYGGDITRKRKLLEKQREGKKRMKQVGNVEIPQEAFFALFKIER